MALYEHVVIARQDISPQQAEALNDQLKHLIEEGGGRVAKIEYWGLRNLTVRVEELDLELSPVLARRDRDRERDRERRGFDDMPA